MDPSESSTSKFEIPENFNSSLQDFIKDLCLTFPEYIDILSPWVFPTEESLQQIYGYCLQVYPQRFFDILYQNDDIFLPTNEENVEFLPGIDFRVLFNAPDVSEATKQTMWKYLQLILITIMSSVKDKTNFGETMNLFEGIDEGELQSKLTDTISNLTNFFKNMSGDNVDVGEDNVGGDAGDAETDDAANAGRDGAKKSPFDPTGIHDHLKTLFEGKIGKLAKELAEELSGDLMDIFSEDGHAMPDSAAGINTQDIFKKLMKNPKKIMELLKTVGSKLETKMKDGDISKEEIMKEAGELMGKMKDMGNGKEFQEMMKNLTKNMGGLGGLAGALGKDAKFDFAGMQREMKKGAQAEKMREKLEKRRGASDKSSTLEPVGDKHYVFKTGDAPQQKSSMRIPTPVPAPAAPNANTDNIPTDDWLIDNIVPDKKNTNSSSANKKKKNKNKK
jgi:hypothetical protein